MAQYLFVPIKMDALCLTNGGAVLDAYEAFRDLPRFDPIAGDYNAGAPYLSSSIESAPFNDRNLFLPSGVHLHWALPPAFTRGSQHIAPDGSADVQFAPAPNRWIVVRSISNDGVNWTVSAVNSPSEPTGGNTGRWIIESDFIATERATEKRFDSQFVTYPVPSEVEGVHNGNFRPDRFLGRVSILDAAGFVQSAPSHYLPSIAPKLTAVGYGDPAFAAFYPNCIGVFGMHHAQALHPQNTRYDLFGWYSDPADDDPLLAAIRSFTATPNGDLRKLANRYAADARRSLIPEDSSNTPLSAGDFAFAFFKSLEEDSLWLLDPSEFAADPAGKLIESAAGPLYGIICYSRLILKKNHSFGPLPPVSLPVGIGRTGSEALAAVLANQIAAPGETAPLEDLLESLSLSKELAGSHLDAFAQFRQARHAKGFHPVSGESLWTVRPTSTGSVAPDIEATLPDDLAHTLNLLNRVQKDYDRQTFEIESRQQRLFSAWVRFMQASYPDNPEFLVNFEDDALIASAGNLIRERDLDPLKAARGARGGLAFSRRSDGTWTATLTSPVVPGENTAASALKAQFDLVQTGLVSLNQDRITRKLPPLLLSLSAGPRFYAPSEPVLLFFGDPHFRPSTRYDQTSVQAHVRTLTAFRPSQVSAVDVAEMMAQLDQIRAITTDGFKEGKNTDTEDQIRPWNPFLLEWEALIETTLLFRPGEHAITRGLGNFHAEYIRGDAGRRTSLLHLTPPPDENPPANSIFRPMRGRTVLSSHPLLQLSELLDNFEANPPDAAGSSSTQAAARIQQATALLNRVRQSISNDFHCLAQTLGGFNRALLMHRSAFQVPIADPIPMLNPPGFEAYRLFTEEVRTALQDAPFLDSPEPDYGFYPIQSGRVLLQRLRVVDTFGQVLEINQPQLICSTSLGGGTEASKHRIILSPRITQPARLNFRWLSAAAGDIESNEHPATTPVCGWLAPNHIDQSFDIYAADGTIQGAVDSSGRFRRPPGQVTGPVRPEDIANPYLRSLVRFLAADPARLKTFTTNLNSALDQIDPESFAQHRARALLVGRPLALVRACVNLELKGLPATDQSWNEVRLQLANPHRDPSESNFRTVQFPIRIGDHQQFNDGVTAYWLEDGSDLKDPIFSFDATAEKSILWHSIDDPAMKLSLLIDPRAQVTASCGALPTKSIRVPRDQFAAALRNMEVSFLVAPILTEPDKTLLPLPSDPNLTWTWLQRDGPSWTVIPEMPVLLRQTILNAFPSQGGPIWDQLIAEGWIRVLDDYPDRAVVLRQPASGPLSLEGFDAPAVRRVIEAASRGIDPIEIHARFGPRAEIREGYLRLSQEFSS